MESRLYSVYSCALWWKNTMRLATIMWCTASHLVCTWCLYCRGCLSHLALGPSLYLACLCCDFMSRFLCHCSAFRLQCRWCWQLWGRAAFWLQSSSAIQPQLWGRAAFWLQSSSAIQPQLWGRAALLTSVFLSHPATVGNHWVSRIKIESEKTMEWNFTEDAGGSSC